MASRCVSASKAFATRPSHNGLQPALALPHPVLAPKTRSTLPSGCSQSCAAPGRVVQPRRGVASRATSVPAGPQFTSLDEAVVEEIMVPHPITLTPDMSCKAAARQLLDADIASAPVVDANGRLIGILSESDLLWKSAGTPLEHTIIPPTYIGAFDLLISLRDSKQVQAEIDKILARTVKEAMCKQPVSIKPSALLSEAAHTMLQHKVHALPVVDEGGKVVGVVTQHDILRGMVAEQLPLL